MSAGVVQPSTPTGTLRVVGVVLRGNFPFCPICFENPGDSDEHVPPAKLGGQIMCNTCTHCNNKLGSYTEASLLNWFDNVLDVSFQVDDDPRRFGHETVPLLTTETGQLILMSRQANGLARGHASDGKRVRFSATFPAAAEVRNALLKNAYLAASIALGGIPSVASAREIRSELMAVIACKRRAEVRAGPHAQALNVWRTDSVASPPSVALVQDIDENQRSTGELKIVLGGAIAVSWPFPEYKIRAEFDDPEQSNKG